MKTAARWTLLFALFAIPFLPLYVSNELFFPFITGKNFAFRILIEIAVGSYAVLAIMDRRYRPRFSWILAVFAGLVAWMVVANLFGVNVHKAFWSNFERMDGWVTLIHLFGLFFVAGAVLTAENLWRRWWLFFVGVAAAVSIHGLFEIFAAMEAHQASLRVAGTLGNPIYLAVYLMFAILVAAWLAIESKGWLRYGLIGFMALGAVVLFATGSRGPLIGLAAGVTAAAALWIAFGLREKKGNGLPLGVKVAAGTLLAIVLAFGAVFVARDSAFVKDNYILTRVASVFSLNQELAVRTTIWGIALTGAQEDPLTGWGQEGFNQVFNTHYKPSLYKQESWFDRAHNMYLDWLVAGGVPAFVLFMALLVLVALTFLRNLEMSRAQKTFLLAALAAYAVQALVVFDNLFSYVPLVMFFAMAHASIARPVARIDSLPEVTSESGAAVVGSVAVAAVVGTIWIVNVPGIRAANHLVYAITPNANLSVNLNLFKAALADGSFGSQEIREQLVSFGAHVSNQDQVPAMLRDSFLELTVREIKSEVDMSPNDARLRIQYSNALQNAGDGEGALAQIDAAIALSPLKQALHLTRGFKLYELDRMDEAREAFKYAYDLDRSFPEVAISAATGYVASGDVAGGKALLMEAIGTTTPDSDTLFYAYYHVKQWNDLIDVAQTRVAASPSAESRYRLAQAYAVAGRLAEARAEIQATIAAYPGTRSSGEALMTEIFSPAR